MLEDPASAIERIYYEMYARLERFTDDGAKARPTERSPGE
jgi:hypothetical protein